MSSHSTEDIPLVELITKRTLEALPALQDFDTQTVERLSELESVGQLDSYESIVKALTGEDVSQANATP